jgi:hypothetical protein
MEILNALSQSEEKVIPNNMSNHLLEGFFFDFEKQVRVDYEGDVRYNIRRLLFTSTPNNKLLYESTKCLNFFKPTGAQDG